MKTIVPAFILGAGLLLTGCAGDSSSRNRTKDTNTTSATADHTGAMNGTGGTAGSGPLGTGTAQKGTDQDSDRRNRTGMTGMDSGTTGGGNSLSGTDRGNNPHRKDR